MRRLESLSIVNFKSIRDQHLELGALNLFIGGNGSGKSNLLETFTLLREIVDGNLAAYTLKKGGADNLLHFGRKRSSGIRIEFEFTHGQEEISYSFELRPNEDDLLTFAEEFIKGDPLVLAFESTGITDGNRVGSFGFTPPGQESRIRSTDHPVAKRVLLALQSYRSYHFHDTSDSAKVKLTGDLEDNRFLRPNAENLAAFLYFLQEREPSHFDLIEQTIRQIAPFFDRFVLAPSKLNPDKIRLEWREKGSDAYFNASSLSDGTLRFICLTTLLLQPELPSLILLDEPELGLHPAAIGLLAEMLSSASERTQIISATQSVTLVNQFGQDVIWAVDREDGQSVFRRITDLDMSAWLDDYSLGELWEKNLLGARP